MKRITSILLCVMVFFLIIEGRTFWDSYRFFRKGAVVIESDQILGIRYFGSSLAADPLIPYYSEKSRERLDKLLNQTSERRIKTMILDEMKR